MSNTTKIMHEYNGAWVPPVDLYVEHGGVWTKAKSKLIGANGSWVEVFDNEPKPVNGIVELNALSYRAGTANQGALVLRGVGMAGVQPTPNDYFFYPLKRNLAENIGNSTNMIGGGDVPVAPTTSQGGGMELSSSAKQFIRMPTDAEGGVDLIGMVGASNGQRYWLIGLQFFPTSFPTGSNTIHVMYAGLPGRRIFLTYNSTGDLTLTWDGPARRLELTIPSAVTLNEWIGVWIKHDPASSSPLTMQTHQDQSASDSNIPYFIPTMTEADAAIKLGVGQSDGVTVVSPEYFDASNTHVAWTRVNDRQITQATDAYYCAMPGETMLPNTGQYYIEFSNAASYDVQFGVGEPGANLANAPAISGWVTNTINGRRFNHQTGGGTNWGSMIPANSRIGLLYNSDTGQLQIFVNGVSRGFPFTQGTIAVPVRFIIGGRGQTSTSNVCSITVGLEASTWVYPIQPPVKEFPKSSTVTAGVPVYMSGILRNWFIRAAPYISDDIQNSLIDPNATFNINWKNRSTLTTTTQNSSILKQTPAELTTMVPNLPVGDYEISVTSGRYTSAPKTFSIVPFNHNTTPVAVDFATVEPGQLRDLFVRAHKAWGGANGGVIAENVFHDVEAGLLNIRACGDLYTGPLRGVNASGERTAMATRIGGALVTREYYGPGSFRVVAKLPYEDGAVSAFWTFHYEEGYAGTPLFDEHIADGISQSGTLEGGYYTVRTHEIDIEIPTALKTDPDPEVVSYRNARFNTWRGENRTWGLPESDPNYRSEYTDTFINHGVDTNDGLFHEFRFDWHLDGIPRVEFYIDGVLKNTVYDTVPNIPGRFWIGVWFPTGANANWAGKSADYDEEWMQVKSISITPYNSEGLLRVVGESYPMDHYRDFYDAPLK